MNNRKMTAKARESRLNKLPNELRAYVITAEEAVDDAFNWANIELHSGVINEHQRDLFDDLMQNVYAQGKH